MHVRLLMTFTFEAAHFLPSFPDGHKCRRMHGHSFRVDVVVSGDVPEGQHYLIDYGELAETVEPVRLRLDHHLLNEIEGLEHPTSEMLAGWIWDRIKPDVPMLEEIRVHETCLASCEYRG
ncbi:MAG: 6-carboxytetrahydropterin synthase QueD [Deltaproteobacteria bacterium]|nr:6-carboxytetrahydropterin synthase QueD [Deltaproteobacteria bacterium]